MSGGAATLRGETPESWTPSEWVHKTLATARLVVTGRTSLANVAAQLCRVARGNHSAPSSGVVRRVLARLRA
jgi:hypothetical protein